MSDDYVDLDHPVFSRITKSIDPYSAGIDLDIYRVAKEIGRPGFKYMTEIAEATGLEENYVELIQTLLCAADWCNYGTSPRGCFPDDDNVYPQLLEQLKSYIAKKWDVDADNGEEIEK